MTGELGNKIDSLWEIFWNGGITNQLDVVEQMTYLMFIKDLDDTDNLRAKEAAIPSFVMIQTLRMISLMLHGTSRSLKVMI